LGKQTLIFAEEGDLAS